MLEKQKQQLNLNLNNNQSTGGGNIMYIGCQFCNTTEEDYKHSLPP